MERGPIKGGGHETKHYWSSTRSGNSRCGSRLNPCAGATSGPQLFTSGGGPTSPYKTEGQADAPTLHFNTADTNPTSAYVTGRPDQATQTWTGNGSEKLPCPGGIHWISNKNNLTVSHCLEYTPPEPPTWTPPEYPPFTPKECVEYRLEKSTSTWDGETGTWSAWTDWPDAGPKDWGVVPDRCVPATTVERTWLMVTGTASRECSRSARRPITTGELWSAPS